MRTGEDQQLSSSVSSSCLQGACIHSNVASSPGSDGSQYGGPPSPTSSSLAAAVSRCEPLRSCSLHQVARRATIIPDRSSSRSSHVCRVIYYLMVTCFVANLLGLLGLQLLPYVRDHVINDVEKTVPWQRADAVRPAVSDASSVISRRLREVGQEPEDSLVAEGQVPEDPPGLSPFANPSSDVRKDWEETRKRFSAASVAFPINQPQLCGSADTFLVVMVTSAVPNFARRRAIRDTWGSAGLEDPSSRLVFLVGELSDANATTTRRLKEESLRHGDVIQTNVTDAYSHLAFKSVAMLKWMSVYCRTARYLLKSDDDMYINLANLRRDLERTVHKRFIMGEIIAGAQPMQERSSKWYTPRDVFPMRRYPKYISGSAYVISGDLVADLYAAAAAEPEVFWLEDIFVTGICAKKAQATHVFNGKFGYKRRRLSPCLFRTIVTGHRLSTAELYRMWEALRDPHLNCSGTRTIHAVA